MNAPRSRRLLLRQDCQDDTRLMFHEPCQEHFESHEETVRADDCILDFLVPAPAATESVRPPCRDENSSTRQITILLVEDNRAILLYLARELGEHRYTVSTAANLAAARRLADSDDFDLLISDIELPDGTGLDLMRELSRDRGLPGIAISALGSDDDICLSHAAGFVVHLAKPFSFQTLEATIRRVVSAHGSSPSPR